MLKRLASLAVSAEGFGFLATTVLGVACLAYVTITWVLHLISRGQPLVALAVSVVAVAATAGAIARVPLALITVFGAAVAIGTAFLLGAGNLVVP